jgi:hypothetical protein
MLPPDPLTSAGSGTVYGMSPVVARAGKAHD